MNRSLLLATSILLFLGANSADFASNKCSKLTTYTDCINSVNNGIEDRSKCLPILSTPASGENRSLTCASYADVKENNYTIDYQANLDTISDSEKSQINQLIYN
jgi:hypothetical protein